MNYLCGCSFYVGRQKNYLPQVQLESHTAILSNTSRTTLKQTFSNSTSQDVKECTYMFPMYDGVSVVAFICRIGSRVLRGVVKERSQAKATFDAAVSRGESAGLLERLPEASDVFSTRLGNIPANEKVHVEISYVGELKHDAEADGIRFTIPTRIAPRYGTLESTQSKEGSSVQEKGGMSIIVDASVAKGSFIRGIQSPTHPIAVTMGSTSTSGDADPEMHQASATLSLGSTELDKDFVLIVLTKEIGTPKAILESHPNLPNQRALMLTLVPKFSLPPISPEIVFVADRSGSMQGNVPTLISALKVFIKSLPVGVKFNICSFGSRHAFLWPKSQAYSRDSMNEALAHVQAFGADFGGTETFSALEATIDNRYGDIPCEVMLLTDGDIWNQLELFTFLNSEVKKSNSSLRVFALGIGNGVSHALIEGVARAGNGFAQTVDNNEKLDSKVIRMLKGGLSPHTTDYSLEVKYENEDDDFDIVDKVTDALKVMLSEEAAKDKPEEEKEKKENKPTSFFSTSPGISGPEKPPSAENDNKDPFAHLPTISVPKIIQAPQTIPPLFPFSRTSVYLLFSGESAQKTPKSVTLRAKSEHSPLELEIPVEVLTTPGKTIHQLAARKAIQELEEGRGWIYEAKDKDNIEKSVKDLHPSRFDEMVQREAVRIGVRYQVGGKWCSFVAVKDNDKENAAAQPEDPVENEVEECKEMIGDSDEDEAMGFSLFDDGSLDQMTAPPVPQSQHSGGFARFCSFGGSPPRQVAAAPVSRSGGTSMASQPGYKYAGMSSMTLSSDSRFSTRSAGAVAPQAGQHEATGSSRRKKGASLSVRGAGPMRGAPRGGGRGSGRGGSAGFSSSSNVNSTSFGLFGDAGPSFEAECAFEAVGSKVGKTDNEKVHCVIDLQDFEGWWEQSDELFSTLEMDVTGARSKRWVTVLVVKWLEVKMMAEKEVWDLVVDKAKAWLAGQVMGEGEMEKLEKAIMEIINHDNDSDEDMGF
ncbi:MAG: hypothetical protein Q9170_002101 [Blastenia crenularia]